MDFDTFAQAHNVSMEAVFIDYRPNGSIGAGDTWPHFEWICTLKCGPDVARTYSFPYRMGIAHAEPARWSSEGPGAVSLDATLQRAHPKARKVKPTAPKLADVLDSLRMDSQCESPFEAWCDEYGHNPDSRAAESIYHSCRKVRASMLQLLGPQAFAAFLECESC